MKIVNAWFVLRVSDEKIFQGSQDKVIKLKAKFDHRPLHQPNVKERPDLSRDELKKHTFSNTALMFHGTRTVNVKGILDKSLILPKKLIGVATNGAMFGPGLYFADDWGKSAQYTSRSGSLYSGGRGGISSRGCFMFACDVVVGKAHCPSVNKGFSTAPSGHHCVFGKGGHTKSTWGSQLQNNEWIIYNSDQQRLRFLVEFKG